jgi:hypothetical protein
MKNDDKGMSRKDLAADIKADKRLMGTLKVKKKGSAKKPLPENAAKTILNR